MLGSASKMILRRLRKAKSTRPSRGGINHDLGHSAPEGMTDEEWRKVRKRAGWLADCYVRQRKRNSQLSCDNCGFDALVAAAGTPIFLIYALFVRRVTASFTRWLAARRTQSRRKRLLDQKTVEAVRNAMVGDH